MHNRYKRNISTLTVAESERLKKYRVCVVGCGGLGGYIIEMLSRIGIGHITVIDSDSFEETNLNRQLISTEDNIGKSKVVEAKERIKKVNSLVDVTPLEVELTFNNSKEILNGHDLVIDALDNIESRKVLQHTCEELNIAIIHGAIAGWYGQVSTILPGDRTFDIIYKNKSKGVELELGNPSFTPGSIASIQVSEAIKYLLGRGEMLSKKLLMIDLLYNEYTIINL